VKLVRVLSRIVLLSLAAGAFVGLTGLYGRSIRTPLPDPIGQAERQHRPSEPEVSQFPEFIGELEMNRLHKSISLARLRVKAAH
jgi:hypothetical protein